MKETICFLISTTIFLFHIANAEDLVEPHLVNLGATGTGKSSLANVLIGENPDCNTCTFPVCPGGDSCTKETKFAVGQWVGDGAEFTVVDTPGNIYNCYWIFSNHFIT